MIYSNESTVGYAILVITGQVSNKFKCQKKKVYCLAIFEHIIIIFFTTRWSSEVTDRRQCYSDPDGYDDPDGDPVVMRVVVQ